jgi:hypothetical protein
MRQQDQVVFAQAARQFRVWILVRRTNPHSLQYIGKEGYRPKPIECKAKTADQDCGSSRCAGLVVDPTLLADVFLPVKRPGALKEWSDFCRAQAIGEPGTHSRYSVDVDAKSKHYGCLMLGGAYIHGDYDLKDIVLADRPRGNLAAVESLNGQLHMRGPRLIPVQNYINDRIGTEMIQHGGDAQFKDHSDGTIDVFGPEGEQTTLADEAAVRTLYDAWKRVTLTHA